MERPSILIALQKAKKPEGEAKGEDKEMGDSDDESLSAMEELIAHVKEGNTEMALECFQHLLELHDEEEASESPAEETAEHAPGGSEEY